MKFCMQLYLKHAYNLYMKICFDSYKYGDFGKILRLYGLNFTLSKPLAVETVHTHR